MKDLKLLIFLSVLLTLCSCEKIDNHADNPFRQSEIGDTTTKPLDINTIEGLHQNIFSVRCANPTCHDGSFEPDFRTVQSTYSSLVYHPVTKNDAEGSYKYRVVPGDAEASWIMRRVTTSDEVLGRMPLYGEALSQEQIEAIRTWINNGAKDALNNDPAFPNLPPVVYGYQLLDATNSRVDTIRVNGWASPMILKPSANYNMVFYVVDDTTETANLRHQKLEVSYDGDNFQPFKNFTPVKLYETVTVVSINTQGLPANTPIYFRYYLEDEHGGATEMPENASAYWLKDHYSFIIQ